MNSKVFIVVGYGAWYLTFLLGFFILAPSTDDGYYTIASLGGALKGTPGFWIGDDFTSGFFLPTAFTYFYGLLLKSTMMLGFDFGPFGFRFYHFLFVLLLPILSTLMLRRYYPDEYRIRLLLFLTCLSLTHFVHSAATVRPEVLGVVLFTGFLCLRIKQVIAGPISAFVLALSGILHPVFTLLAVVVFGFELLRLIKNLGGLNKLRKSAASVGAFALPFVVLVIFYVINITEFREQVLGRAAFLSSESWTTPTVIWNNLLFWNNSDGIEYGIFSGYPALGIVLVMFASTLLVLTRGRALWRHNSLWICWPVFIVQWLVFLLLPPFLPYLAFSSFLASLNIALLWQPSSRWAITTKLKWALGSCGLALCLVFIGFHGGKFLFVSGEHLTPAGLHSVMSPILEDDETELYTSTARLIPPLIDYFANNSDIRLNLTYLAPNCFRSDLLTRANQHSLGVLPKSDLKHTYWGLNRRLLSPQDDGALRFNSKGSQTSITLTSAEQVYSDDKNLIVKASSVRSVTDNQACFEGS